jgi:hypothetical protein
MYAKLFKGVKEGKKIHLQKIDEFGDSSHRCHFPRVLNKQHNPPKKNILERLSWMKTRQMGFYFYTLLACIFAFFLVWVPS